MALAHIETGNRDIPGDRVAAIGPLQIHRIYAADVNRILKLPVFLTVKHGPNGECLQNPCPDNRHSLLASLEMTRIYLKHWSGHFRRKHGWEFSYPDLCALHRHGTSYTPGACKSTLIDRIRSRKLKALMMQPTEKGKK